MTQTSTIYRIEELPELLVEIRKTRGLSQARLAERCGAGEEQSISQGDSNGYENSENEKNESNPETAITNWSGGNNAS